MKARIDKTQQSSRCRLCSDRRNDETPKKRLEQICTEGV